MFRLSSSTRLLWEIIFSRFHWRLILLTLSLLSTTFGLMAPYFQKQFIDHINSPTAWEWLILSFAALLFSLILIQAINYLGAREALIFQRKLSQRLYEKTLELRTDSLDSRPIGEIVSIYTVDVPGSTFLLETSLPQGLGMIMPLLLAPVAINWMFDIPLWPIVSMMLIIGILSFILAHRQSRFFITFKKLAAERIGLVSEWIQSLKTLRILSWIPWYENKIIDVRVRETNNRITMLHNGQTMNAINSSATFLINIVGISTFIYLSQIPITSGALLSLLWIIAVFLTRPFRIMPWFFTFVFDAWTSIQRVSQFLDLTNKNPYQRSNFSKIKTLAKDQPAIIVKNLNLMIGPSQILKNISLTINEGEFVAIVGEVGSGKSLLLLSLIGETGAHFDQYQIGSNDATKMNLSQLRQFFTYVPQDGFLMSANLRENVALEYDLNSSHDQHINEALQICQFDWSQERLSHGLETEIGERGVNLSGGQKQRTSLARAEYFDSPIILLDDCLSAVDVDTEQKLIQQLICHRWKERTRILVTHRLSALQYADRVIYIKNGEVVSHA